MNDIRRPDATGPDYEYSLSIEAVADRYAGAGYPRTIRTLQRYCASGHLDAQKIATALGDKYYVAPYSVSRHIAQIAEMAEYTTRHDMSRPVDRGGDRVSPIYRAPFQGATGHDSRMSGHDATKHETPRHNESPHGPIPATEALNAQRPEATNTLEPAQTNHDQPRHVVPDPSLSPRYVERIEAENAFLRNQVDKKDQQIDALLERDRETNVLVQGLQRMLGPLLGMPGQNSRSNSEPSRDTPRGDQV